MVLKKMVMGNFGSNHKMDPDVADAIDFMVEKVNQLNSWPRISHINVTLIAAGKSVPVRAGLSPHPQLHQLLRERVQAPRLLRHDPRRL